MAIKKNVKGHTFRVPVKFDDTLSEPLKLRAFLFSRNKRFIETTVVKNEEVVFKTKVKHRSDVLLLIAPEKKGLNNVKNYYQLLYRHKAYRPIIKIGPTSPFDIATIPSRYLPFWYNRKCRVTGNVSKNFDIDGVMENKGLCKMKVHICEVDKIHWLLPNIPDDIIIKIPDLIFNPELPIPVPAPDPIPVTPFPGPFPGPFPRPIFTTPIFMPKLRSIESIFSATSLERKPVSLGRDKERNITDSIKPILSNSTIISQLETKNPKLIRKTILDNFHLFHPIFCIVPWLWPYFYKCDELDVVYTDANGDFDTDIWYPRFGDHPDLYFWVEAFIEEEWKTVYKPSLPCHTYWNYPCGTDVNITITDPRVYWSCTEDIEGQIIWIKSVGHHTSISHIQQNNATKLIQSKILHTQGLTDRYETHGNYRRPFGSGLYFIMQFSRDLPSNKYTYYRWSYRKIRNANFSNALGTVPKSIDNLVYKYYSYRYKDAANHFHFAHNKKKLGPIAKGTETDLYLIPTSSPTAAPFNATELDADWDNNTRSISFDSQLDGDGLYEFTLELFDASGNKVTNIPNELFQVPKNNNRLQSVDAPAINLVSSGANKCSAFKMVMRIDNSKCEADIYKIKVDGREANPNCCGFVPYIDKNASNIEVTFRAYHPQNFADFDFNIQKGTCSDSAQTNKTNVSHKMVIGNANTNSGMSYVRNNVSIYKKTFKAKELLGVCKLGGKAAFAEHLYMHALATDGNNVLRAFDDSALAAFALEPKVNP